MWKEEDNKLYRKVTFKDFREAFVFLNRVAKLAEIENHHPVIRNKWNEVELWLSTHEAGDTVTDKDRNLSAQIDELLATPPEPSIGEQPHPDDVRLFTDGGSRGNPGPSAGGYVLYDKDNTMLVKGGVYLGITTNNQAEYQALKLGLEVAQKMGVSRVAVHMDSMLVVNQMKGIYKVKNRDLWPIHGSITELAA